MKQLVLIGADPEVFVKQGGRFVSGFNLIPGTKADPFPVENGAVQVDGMALEYNIDPAATEEEFIHNISHVLQQLRAMVPDYEVAISPVAQFDKGYVDQQPHAATELGCEPDYDAYIMGVNPKPDGSKDMRTAAGHIHVGWSDNLDTNDPRHFELCTKITKQLDVYLGLNSVLFDDDVMRREMYGKAGSFRPKPYGLEYRVLSNKWLSSDYLTGFVYRSAQACMDKIQGGTWSLQDLEPEVCQAINTSDTTLARSLLMECEGMEVVRV